MRRLLARGRALSWCACAAAALAVAGCAGAPANTGNSVTGHTLTIYLSKPPGGLSAEQQDVILAEQLALRQGGNRVSTFTVKTVQVSAKELSDNARGAIADPTTIAYLGELQPGTSGQTIGISNAQDVLQVSPTDTAVELTQSTPAVPGSPDLYYESLTPNGRTFARMVPTDKLEARALVGVMQSLGVKRLYLKSDGSSYGAALKGLIISDVSGAGITIASSSSAADAVVYAGMSSAGATALFDQASSANPSVKLFAPSALAPGSFATALPAAAQRNLLISSPGFGSTDMPPQAKQFVSAFQSAYRHAPATQAIFGYAAMEAVLSALHKAGSSANNRSTVIKDFFGLRNHDSVLGTYSIKSGGDIAFVSGAPFLFSRVRAGKLVPFKAVEQQG